MKFFFQRFKSKSIYSITPLLFNFGLIIKRDPFGVVFKWCEERKKRGMILSPLAALLFLKIFIWKGCRNNYIKNMFYLILRRYRNLNYKNVFIYLNNGIGSIVIQFGKETFANIKTNFVFVLHQFVLTCFLKIFEKTKRIP